jgi:hypothetical protein
MMEYLLEENPTLPSLFTTECGKPKKCKECGVKEIWSVVRAIIPQWAGEVGRTGGWYKNCNC